MALSFRHVLVVYVISTHIPLARTESQSQLSCKGGQAIVFVQDGIWPFKNEVTTAHVKPL